MNNEGNATQNCFGGSSYASNLIDPIRYVLLQPDALRLNREIGVWNPTDTQRAKLRASRIQHRIHLRTLPITVICFDG